MTNVIHILRVSRHKRDSFFPSGFPHITVFLEWGKGTHTQMMKKNEFWPSCKRGALLARYSFFFDLKKMRVSGVNP